MKSPFAVAREFVRGVAGRSDLVYLISKGKALLEEEIAHTSLVALYQGKWADGVDTDWDASAIARAQRPEPRTLVVGEDGDVEEYLGPGASVQSTISPAPVLIRNAKAIEGFVYACGMKRQVYKREGQDKWKDVSAPFPNEDEEVGFEAVDGFSQKEIYASGWAGEVWQFDGKKWTDRSGLTNLILTALCCAPNGVVYIGGQQGTFLRGRRAEWEAVEWDSEMTDDIWDLCWFQDRLYVATMSTLYTLEGDALEEVDFGEAGPPTCYNLTTAEGILWSIGRDDVVSFDGKAWQRYE